jgi:hypothetical protein
VIKSRVVGADRQKCTFERCHVGQARPNRGQAEHR